jgi:murein DD-endopeptidase
MPNRLRSPLLALAVAALVFGCPSATASSEQPVAVEIAKLGLERPKPIPRVAARKRKPKPTLGERAARIALRAVGVPYRWGGSSPSTGFDCSGLVYWAYKHVGVELPHSSYALYNEGRGVGRSRMRPGDVLVFSGLGHVGLYVGRGRMVHAPSSGRLVEVVRLGRSHYGGRIVGIRRIA